MKYRLLLVLLLIPSLFATVKPGVDVLFESQEFRKQLTDQRIGLITNQSAISTSMKTTFEMFKKHQGKFELVAIFSPEHGYYGAAYAYEHVKDKFNLKGIPLYSLYGSDRRPTAEMLAGIDLLVYDIQDIGSRSYTYLSTLFYCMEEAAKRKIPFIVLDRPNPMGGIVVDGPAIKQEWRSFLGYINIPYCHGMTIGELARLFNKEYRVGCDLTVIPIQGWKRGMPFTATGLPWVPTSPQIPEADTPFYYPTTGLIGHCSITSIGIGYTLPFKLVGAPWIDADKLASKLNKQKLKGVYFQPFHFRPFFGKFKLKTCQGVRIVITDPNRFLPITTQFTMMGVLKQLYPKEFKEAMTQVVECNNKRDVFNKLSGNEEILRVLNEEKFVIWKLRETCVQARDKFLPIRQKYLIY